MKQMIPDALKFPSARNHSDVLYEKLRDAITSSEFPPGYVFPNEVEFCSLLNVGRSTLREAYKMLEADGWGCAKRAPAVSSDINRVVIQYFFILWPLDTGNA